MSQFRVAIVFTILTYSLGCFFVFIPSLYIQLKEKFKDVRNDLCLGSDETKDELAIFTIISVSTISVLYLLLFKLLQGKGRQDHVWYYVKFWYWVCNPVFAGALVIYQFSHSLIHTVFIFPIIESASCWT